MAVDRLSVTVPSELGAQLRALAAKRGETVSQLVTDAIAHEVRMAALDMALAEAERRFGPIPDDALRAADVELADARRRTRSRKSKRRA